MKKKPPARGRQGQDGHFCSGEVQNSLSRVAAINRLYMLLTIVGGAMVLRLVIFTAHSMKKPSVLQGTEGKFRGYGQRAKP